MRAAFFIVLAANLLFLAWAEWVDVPRAPGSTDTLAKLPRLKLVSEEGSSPKPTSGIAQKMSYRPAGALSCTSIGPFYDGPSATKAASVLSGRGLQPRQRTTESETVQGYWVFVAGMQSNDDVAGVLDKLSHSGFTDVHVMKESPLGRRVSVGLFSQRPRAENRADAVRALGLEPQIVERRFPGTVFWVDVDTAADSDPLKAPGIWADSEAAPVHMEACPLSTAPRPAENGSAQPAEDKDVISRALPRTTVASAPPSTPRRN
ncbi:MAG TPA: hypothetical protein VMT29_03760 [Steroidobacteraceae bacterium]|nr:hypothetical protein [Steroidobacteraceae bacterium]